MHDGMPYGRIQGQGHEPIQGSSIENLQSREGDRQSPTGLIFIPGWLYCFFSRSRAEVEPVDRFLRFMDHTTCFHTRMVLFGVTTMSLVHLGVISPTTSPKVMRIGTFKPNVLNMKITISCNFRRMLGPSNASHGWFDMTSYHIQDGGQPPL